VCERTYVVVDVERGDEVRVVEDANCSNQHVVSVSVSVCLSVCPSVTACRQRQRVCLSVRLSVTACRRRRVRSRQSRVDPVATRRRSALHDSTPRTTLITRVDCVGAGSSCASTLYSTSDHMPTCTRRPTCKSSSSVFCSARLPLTTTTFSSFHATTYLKKHFRSLIYNDDDRQTDRQTRLSQYFARVPQVTQQNHNDEAAQ